MARALLVFLVAASAGCGDAASPTTPASTPTGVRYFIAVHNEPSHFPGGESVIAGQYEVLRGMVADADAHHVKLTLMLSAQWADYIVADGARTAELLGWQAAGHELALHHHSIYHTNWDGYTDYSATEATAQRLAQGRLAEPYLGTLSDMMARLQQLGSSVVSACANDEQDKNELPAEILYDTCSGFANHGEPGTRESDALTGDKGRNDFVSVGTWKGVERHWLTHYQITQPERTELAKAAFLSMESGAYGSVLHSSANEASELASWLDFLATEDPDGSRSMTVRQLVESDILPSQTLDDAKLAELDLPDCRSPTVACPPERPVCDATGACVGNDGSCGASGQACAAGTVCAPAGSCVPDCRIAGNSCPAGLPECVSATGLCIAASCDPSSPSCPQDQVCAPGINRCLPDCRIAGCPAQLTCEPATGLCVD